MRDEVIRIIPRWTGGVFVMPNVHTYRVDMFSQDTYCMYSNVPLTNREQYKHACDIFGNVYNVMEVSAFTAFIPLAALTDAARDSKMVVIRADGRCHIDY